MGHQHWQLGICQNVTGRATEDHLAQATLCVGALYQEITALRCRSPQNRFTGAAAFEPYRKQSRRRSRCAQNI